MTRPIDGQSAARGAEMTGRIVVALFEHSSEAADAIRELKDAGFTSEQIGVATQDRAEAVGSARSEPPAERAEDDDANIADQSGTGMAEGAATGALTGGAIGGLVGLIGSLLIPGAGPLVVGGLLASALLGMGVGAATGGLIGALIGMGVPEEDARYFDAGLRGGRTLVTVNTNEAPDEAISILERHGGDLGPSRARSRQSEDYRGEERRSHSGVGYTGPERRLVGV